MVQCYAPHAVSIQLFKCPFNRLKLHSHLFNKLFFQNGISPCQQFPYFFLRLHDWVNGLPHIEIVLRVLVRVMPEVEGLDWFY